MTRLCKYFLNVLTERTVFLKYWGTVGTFAHPGSHKSAIVTDLFLHSMQSCLYTNPHATGHKKSFLLYYTSRSRNHLFILEKLFECLNQLQ